MKNEQLKQVIDNGQYLPKNYYETLEILQGRMNDNDYHYHITTHDDMFYFVTKDNVVSMPLKEFDWKLLWEKLDSIDVNDDDEIEQPFQHFPIGTDRFFIWQWFEWYFGVDIQLEIFD